MGTTDSRALHPGFPGLRILLADDSPVNQQIACEHLRALGCIVDTADNGQEAVELFVPHRYDLVLLDVEMPLLDGCGAAHELRRLEGSSGAGSKIPIIAITGNAQQDDRNRCLSAGMDDVLTKPLLKRDLIAAVQRWAMRHSDDTITYCGNSVSGRAAVDDAPVGLERVVEEFEGERELVVRLLCDFSARLTEHAKTIEAALRDNAFDDVRREAHTIKGGAANLTADVLAQAAATLESASHTRDIRVCLHAFEGLKGEIGRFAAFVHEALAAE